MLFSNFSLITLTLIDVDFNSELEKDTVTLFLKALFSALINQSVEIRPLITTILESEFSGIATRLQQYILIMQRQMMSYMAAMNGPNGRLNESSIQQINNNPQSLEEWSRSTQNLIAANFNEMQSLIAHINIEIGNYTDFSRPPPPVEAVMRTQNQ